MALNAWGSSSAKSWLFACMDACRINAGRFSAGSVTGLTRVPLFVLSTVDDNDVIVDDDDNNNNHNNNNKLSGSRPVFRSEMAAWG